MTTHYQTKPIASTRWRLDPTASTAQFRVPHFWGLVTVKGHFANLDGWLELDHDGTGQLELTIDTISLTTGNSSRDRHLRSADFFDAEQHAQVRFRSTHVGKPTDSELSVAGELPGRRERDHADASADHPAERRAAARRCHHHCRPAPARNDLEPARNDQDPDHSDRACRANPRQLTDQDTTRGHSHSSTVEPRPVYRRAIGFGSIPVREGLRHGWWTRALPA